MTDEAVATKFDTAVVVVHGIGRQARAETLLEWSEPLIRRFDYLARQIGGSAQVTRSRLLPVDEEDAFIVATITVPGEPDQTIAFTEARWADSFVAPPPRDLPAWVLRNGFRAGIRLGMLLLRNSIGTWGALGRKVTAPVPVLIDSKDGTARLAAAERISLPGMWGQLVLVYGAAAFAAVISLVGALAAVIIGWIIPAIALVATLLLVTLARLPIFSRWLSTPVLLLTDFIGDATVWTDQPVRAQAMKDAVRATVRRASNGANRTIVVAHSQGAAVSARALLAPGGPRVDHLVTVGSAVDLLHDTGWQATRRGTPDIVTAWLGRSSTNWTNIWAGFDPVPAGPISARGLRHWREAHARWKAVDACSRRLTRSWVDVANETFGTDISGLSRSERSQVAGGAMFHSSIRERADETTTRKLDDADAIIAGLFPAARDNMVAKFRLAPGPAERRVQNGGSVTTDHITYSRNIGQVIDPLARSIILADKLGTAAEAEQLSRDHARAVRLLVLARLLAIILSASTAPWLVSLVPWISTTAGPLDLAGENELLTYLIEAIDNANLWSLVALSAAALVMYSVLAAIIGGVWNYWTSDLEWKADRPSTAVGVAHVVPFAAVFALVAAPGTYLGLRAAVNILNQWAAALGLEPTINLTPIELAIFSAAVLGILILGAVFGGEFAPLPEIRRPQGDAAHAPAPLETTAPAPKTRRERRRLAQQTRTGDRKMQ